MLVQLATRDWLDAICELVGKPEAGVGEQLEVRTTIEREPIERAIRSQRALVAGQGAALWGYLQWARIDEQRWYITMLVVEDSPVGGPAQARDVLKRLLGELERELDGEQDTTVEVAVGDVGRAGRDHANALLTAGYQCVRMIEDWDGPGRTRLYFVRHLNGRPAERDDPLVLPVAATGVLEALFEEGYELAGICQLPHPHYNLRRRRTGW